MLGHELFEVPPESFIEARNRMAAELKEAGDAHGAAAVKALRRPTVAAYAVNRGARSRPELVAELLDSGRRLVAAQRQVLSGRAGAADELRAATDDRRRIVRELAGACIEAMEDEGRRGEQLRDPVVSTLEAASTDEALGERLREGTIERESAPTAGLGGVEGLAVLAGGREPEGPGTPESAPPVDLREVQRDAKEAAKAADAAERAAARAVAKAERLKVAADDAEVAARAARDEAKRFNEEARTARRRADRAARGVEAARKGTR